MLRVPGRVDGTAGGVSRTASGSARSRIMTPGRRSQTRRGGTRDRRPFVCGTGVSPIPDSSRGVSSRDASQTLGTTSTGGTTRPGSEVAVGTRLVATEARTPIRRGQNERALFSRMV